MAQLEPSAETAFERPRRRLPRPILPCCGGCLLFVACAAAMFILSSPKIYHMPSASMEPTLLGGEADKGDRILCSNWQYRFHPPAFGDIVVFLAPKSADAQSAAEQKPQVENTLAKRVIGLPGDTILIREAAPDARAQYAPLCVVFRNGKQLQEPYIKEPMEPQSSAAVYGVDKPLTLEPDQYYVMGDNRNDSNDSRYWGPLERRRILGKVLSIVSPPERARQFP